MPSKPTDTPPEPRPRNLVRPTILGAVLLVMASIAASIFGIDKVPVHSAVQPVEPPTMAPIVQPTPQPASH